MQDYGSWKRRCLIWKFLLGRLIGLSLTDACMDGLLTNAWIGTSFFGVARCHWASSYLRVIKFQFCSHILDLRLLRIELPLFVLEIRSTSTWPYCFIMLYPHQPLRRFTTTWHCPGPHQDFEKLADALSREKLHLNQVRGTAKIIRGSGCKLY